ncbi:glycoside hydrolase [Aquicoccus sp. SCR17]|nr:glycoside hydrolase [Carideicomes alvinocaridis]
MTLTRRHFALALPALALTACGSRAPAPPPEPGEVQVRPPRFGDSDPVEFEGRPPSAYPVHGIDAARFQNTIDWRRARAAGVNFAWLKATEGGDRIDPQFRANWRNAAVAGVPRGAYHFYYFCTPAEVQARWFIENVPREAGSLPPVLDLEWNPFSPTCTLRPPAETVRAEAATFIRIVTAHYGQAPVIYTTPDFWERNHISRLGREVWVRSVAEHAHGRYDGHPWTFWQYSGTGLVDGIGGDVDLNLFNGSEFAWRAWLARRLVR